MQESRYYELSPIYDSRKSFYNKANVYEINQNRKYLYSYGVLVAMVKGDKLLINENERWYSNTTLRHIKEFARQELGLILTKKEMQKYLIDLGKIYIMNH